MMTRANFKYWISAIAGDAAIGYIAYQWKFSGVEGAGNLFLFLMWFLVVVRFIGAFVADKTKNKRPPGFAHYHGYTEAAVIVFMVWFGMVALPIFYTTALLLLEAAMKREPKAQEGGAA